MIINSTEVPSYLITGDINVDILRKTLNELRHVSYTYLKEIQKKAVNIHKYRINYSDLRTKEDFIFTGIDLNEYQEYNITLPFIFHNNRLEFRRSELYNQPLTNDIISANKSLFIYQFLVFINGYYDPSARVKCREDITSICLRKENMPAKLQEEYNEECFIDILVIPNSSIEKSVIRKSTFNNGGRKITVSNDDENNYVFSMVYVNSETELIKMYPTTKSGTSWVLPAESISAYTSASNLNIMAVVLPNHYETIECPANVNFFKPTDKLMPISKENILTTRTRSSDASVYFDNSIELTEKYYNVFKYEEEHEDKITNYVFYNTRPYDQFEFYTPGTRTYSEFYDILTRYKDSTINPNIDEFVPYEYNYELSDFYKTAIGTTDEMGALVYQINKLCEAVNYWPLASKKYYENLAANFNGYLVDCSKIDLSSKLRTDNRSEVIDSNKHTDFKEERYVFIFINPLKYEKLPYKFFINGVRYIPDELYGDNVMEYVYIPKSLIDSNTIIEIERSSDLVYSYQFTAKNVGNELNLGLEDGVKIPVSSIYFIDNTGKYIPTSYYNLTINNVYLVGAVNPDKDNSQYLVDNTTVLTFKYSNVGLSGKVLTMIYSESPIEIREDMDELDTFYTDLNFHKKLIDVKPDISRIRVFREGRLLPSNMYDITVPNDRNTAWTVSMKKYGTFYGYQVDYIPEGYIQVYYQASIPIDGVVDLRGYIDKPFSLRYYDVYLNGYKLLYNQINRVSDFVIKITNVNTLNHLYIYEKKLTNKSTLFQPETAYISDFLAEKLVDDAYLIDDIRASGTIIPDTSILDITEFDYPLDTIMNRLKQHITENDIIVDEDIDSKFYATYKYYWNHPSIFFIDPNVNYDNDTNRVVLLDPN